MPTAIVTGASRGIGRGISLLLAEKGYKIVSVGTRSASDVAEYIGELTSRSPESIYVAADISTPDGRAHILESAAQVGGFDILVNNAGIAPKVRADLLEMTEESLDRLINTNLKGTFLLTQTAAKQLIERKTDAHKMIINITSISADTSSVNRGEYCISKAGLSMVTKLFADRLAEYGINVYELRPGIIETDMTAAMPEAAKTATLASIPMGRLGQAEDVARAIAFLAAEESGYITGQVRCVDGGMAM